MTRSYKYSNKRSCPVTWFLFIVPQSMVPVLKNSMDVLRKYQIKSLNGTTTVPPSVRLLSNEGFA